jgi:hypothetical protein
MVAAALAVHADPVLAALFVLEHPTGSVVGRVAGQPDVASSVVRVRSRGVRAAGGPGQRGGGAGVVEVALVPAEQAADEVLRWLPSGPQRSSAARAVVFRVQVWRRGDAGPSWSACCWPSVRCWPGRRVVGGVPPELVGVADLAEGLREVLRAPALECAG